MTDSPELVHRAIDLSDAEDFNVLAKRDILVLTACGQPRLTQQEVGID